jgi:ribulose-phosphate 3-epimerase
MAQIIPAILTNDQSDFRHKYSMLFGLSHYFKHLHVDFGDGEFVSAKTILPADLGHFLKSSPFELTAHMMTENPGFYLKDIKAAGFSTVVFHLEAMDSLAAEAFIAGASQLGLSVGVAVNPETPLPKVARYLRRLNLIQLMGVHPGRQGRTFIPETIERIREIKRLTKHAVVAVDGGITPTNAKDCAKAGADQIIVGSAILKAHNPKLALELLLAEAK